MPDGGGLAEVLLPIGRVLIPIGLGLVLRWAHAFGDSEGAVLRTFVVRFTVPVLVFFSVYEARPDSIAAIGPMVAAFALLTAALFVVGWAVASLYRGGPRRAAVHACITFGNYGWMGLGVAQALFGDEGTQRVVYFFLLWWPVFYGFGLPIGLLHVRQQTGGVPLRHAVGVAAPPVAALVLGLILNLARVPVPGLIRDSLKPFGDMTAPVILLSVGMMLDFGRLAREVKPALVISGVRLLASPLAGWALAALLARDPLSFKVMVLEAGMPVATLTPVLAESYAMDRDLVNAAIVLTTTLSLLTLPVLTVLLSA